MPHIRCISPFLKRISKLMLWSYDSSLFKIWHLCFCGFRYFINLCQGIHGGLPGCPEDAAVCRRTAAGKTEVLGRVYTQKMESSGVQTIANTLHLFGVSLCKGYFI